MTLSSQLLSDALCALDENHTERKENENIPVPTSIDIGGKFVIPAQVTEFLEQTGCYKDATRTINLGIY